MLRKIGIINLHDVGLKLIVPIAGWTAIDFDTMQKTYSNIGIQPMDFRFVYMAEEVWNQHEEIDNDSPNCR